MKIKILLCIHRNYQIQSPSLKLMDVLHISAGPRNNFMQKGDQIEIVKVCIKHCRAPRLIQSLLSLYLYVCVSRMKELWAPTPSKCKALVTIGNRLLISFTLFFYFLFLIIYIYIFFNFVQYLNFISVQGYYTFSFPMTAADGILCFEYLCF